MNTGQPDQALALTKNWVEKIVIGMNLCPFASRDWDQGRVRSTVCNEHDAESVLLALASEMQLLESDDSIETTLLVLTETFEDFGDFNQFLDLADALLESLGYVGVFQLATFHPDYVFADSDDTDPANCSNRSPLPMLHLLREASLSKAIALHPDTAEIPARNIRYLRQLGMEAITSRINGEDAN
ncbi:MAG: DUF1415 domain-containing protein [Halioglobus sp.]